MAKARAAPLDLDTIAQRPAQRPTQRPRDAAREQLEPTAKALKGSAFELLDRMIALEPKVVA